jgi:rod shape-determining protein MreC
MGFSANKDSGLNRLNNIVSVPLSPVQGFFTSIGKTVEGGLAFFKDTNAVRKENGQLKAHVIELEKQNSELAALKTKNDDLRQALKLKAQFSNYTLIGANIIALDPGNWFNIFKIDVGGNDGVKADFPVVTSSKGLAGRVMSSDSTSSKVITIIDEESSVAGWISKAGGGHAMVRGDMQLKEQGLCKLNYIQLEVDVEVGDVIETSGLGGIYPKGILIGKVVEVRKTNSEMDRYAIIQPAADFKRLEEVYVLKSANNNEGMGSVVK